MRSRLRAVLATPAGSFSRRLYSRFRTSRLPLLAAALAYYAAFALGPLLLLFAGWLAAVLETRPDLALQYRAALIDLVEQVLPLEVDSTEVVTRSLQLILAELQRGAFFRNAVSVLVLLWASSSFFTSLQMALEVIFHVPKSRGFWRKRLVAVALILTVAVVIAAEIIGGVLASYLGRLSALLVAQLQALNIQLPALPSSLQPDTGSEALRLLIATAVFTACFRYLPRSRSTWRGALLGALLSTLAIAGLRLGMQLVLPLERFNFVYGVITSLVLILLWLYLALLSFLIGALVAAEISAARAAPRGRAQR